MDSALTRQSLSEFCDSSPNSLKVVHINAQSLTYKCHADEFQFLFDNSGHDIISVSETFYKTAEDVVHLPGFHAFTANRTSHDGGGVAVYVRDTLSCKVLVQSVSPLQREQRPDYIILEICLHNATILFATVYRPPKAGHLSEFQDHLFSYCIEYESVIVTGDVNAHFDSTKRCDIADGKGVAQLLEVCNLSRVPFGKTFHTKSCDSALDMIATSCPNKINKYMQIPVCGLSAHDLLYATFAFDVPKSQPVSFSRRDFSKFDCDLFASEVLSAPWEDMLNYTDVNDKLSVFNDILIRLYDKHAPVKSHHVKQQPRPWFTPEVILAMNQRDVAYRRSRRTKNSCDINNYKMLRNKANRIKRDAKISHAYTVFSNATSSKEMWQALKKFNVINNKSTDCKYPPANELNEHYSSVSCIDTKAVENTIVQYEAIPQLVEDQFYFHDITFPDLLRAVNSVKSNATGVDGISLKMLKTCLVELAPAILHIFNVSLQTGQFPNQWKIADIKPIPKKANATTAKDFRPISILCILGKILEKIVHVQITSFMSKNHLFHPLQSGFKPGHSTTTALLKVVGDIREAMHDRLLSLLVLYDFSNAFPSVHHDLLFTKLRHLGLSKPAVDWFRSYLSDRKQQVSTGTEVSSLLHIYFGVPQGSVLGPLLYSLYVNDISDVFKNSSFHLYADDLQNYVTFSPSKLYHAVEIINKEAKKLAAYAKGHNLAINGLKTQVIIIGNPKLIKKLPADKPHVIVENMPLPYLDVVKNLGILIDSNLTWEKFATATCHKCIAALHGIRKHKDLLPMPVRKRLVESLIFPIIDYGITVSVGMLFKSKERLQRIQNSCLRFVLNLPRHEHISQYYQQVKWLRYQQRQNFYLLCLLKKTIVDRSPTYLFSKLVFVNALHNRALRNVKPLLQVPQKFTNKIRGAFWISAVLLWNDLPIEITTSKSLYSFKSKLTPYLLL